MKHPLTKAFQPILSQDLPSHRWILSNGYVPHAFEVLDKAAANFGVAPRYPFWDKPLVEFCLALPGEEKLSHALAAMCCAAPCKASCRRRCSGGATRSISPPAQRAARRIQ